MSFDWLEKSVYWNARYKKGYYYCIPEVNYKWIADFIAWAPGKGILEIEIKRVWSDIIADTFKSIARPCIYNRADDARKKHGFVAMPKTNPPPINKYSWLLGNFPCRWRPTHFTMAAPVELAERIRDAQILPKCFGIWAMRETGGFSLQPARRLCKITPEQQGRFENAISDRAFRWLDSYYS